MGANGLLYVPGIVYLYALNVTSASAAQPPVVVWQYGGLLYGAWVTVDARGRVLVAFESTIAVVDGDTGKELWHLHTAPWRYPATPPYPAFRPDGDVVWVVNVPKNATDTMLFALDSATGDVLGSQTFNQVAGWGWRVNGLTYSSETATLFASTSDTALYAFNVSVSGAPLAPVIFPTL
jgi:hypothetical protein